MFCLNSVPGLKNGPLKRPIIFLDLSNLILFDLLRPVLKLLKTTFWQIFLNIGLEPDFYMYNSLFIDCPSMLLLTKCDPFGTCPNYDLDKHSDHFS